MEGHYRTDMAAPKTKDRASPENDRPAARSKAAGAAPRRARQAKSAYSAAEVEEIFRRFSCSGRSRRASWSMSTRSRCGGGGAVGAGDRRRGEQATRPLFEVADTPQKMLALGEEKLGGYIRTIGLWRNKAKNVIALCAR